MRRFLALLVILLLLGAFVSLYYVYHEANISVSRESVYVGVTFGLNTTQEAKLLVDKVRDYTNFFVITSWPINETTLDQICDYVVNAGMSFIVFFSYISHIIYPWHLSWLDTAKERWGDKFLGVYLYDEPGGHQIDMGRWRRTMREPEATMNASDYSDAAQQFTTSIFNSGSMRDLKEGGIPAFTSDYALYWFDYLAGYDCVFAEFGWNHSRVKHVALCRGAAKVQNRQWGVIITWTYWTPPYLESGEELFHDMVTAHRAGAKYIIVFNYPKINPYGVLTDEHFKALRNFWSYMGSSPRSRHGIDHGEAAFVLPKDYGWGFRWPTDNIWGVWPCDNLSAQIWNKTNALIDKHGLRLDIVYDDPKFNIKENYSKLYFWNNSAT